MAKLKIVPVVIPFIIYITCISPNNRHKEGQAVSTISKPISDSSLLDTVEKQTFEYFWDGAEPNSGMGRERFHVDNDYPEHDKNVVATGGSGFGVMAILAAIHRGFISRGQGVDRLDRIISFL